MKTKIILVSAATFAMLAPAASAQQGTVPGAASGAVTGAVVGGPAGAAVGGVVGAIAGSAVDQPPRRVRYVEWAPADRVVARKRIVCEPIPAPVVITPIPNARHFAYGVVNQQWVLVNPHTRRVARVIR